MPAANTKKNLDLSEASSSYPQLEFHLRADVTTGQGLDLPLFALHHGHFQIDFHALQNMIHVLNAREGANNLKTSEMYAVGIISLMAHKLIRLYRNRIHPEYLTEMDQILTEQLGQTEMDQIMVAFLEALPSELATNAGSDPSRYLTGSTDGVKHRLVVLEELMVHLLALNNPAFTPYDPTFKETFHPLIADHQRLLEVLRKGSADKPGFGADMQNLIDILLAPAKASPDSIQGQLAYIKRYWGSYLGSNLDDLLRGLDLFEEENRFRGGGPGAVQGPSYSGDLLEGENYSEDSDWMPRVVMIARNTLVWLDQLSKRHGRSITRLDQIPDQELDILSHQGFNVLWLIGLWTRSEISKKIKHWCGNPDAESSAYSLKAYRIDPMLGGDQALEDLRKRAWERGIRLASDMVPNHTGLDSGWLKHKPDWFVSTPEPPFPAYTFNGGNLSSDPDMGIYLEDHYYDRSDAAVVFKRVDHRNGDTRYVYHGNDGTSMPWNDTAQLNYLNPELREEIIQVILNVARQFKVIRFDAAMTLAKRHIQRLWFPEPGSGGDIPSRSAHSVKGADFNAALPKEFWREVVDRVAKEVPDTLLLAEAFWMMEGYFVRTLGMHRVYNSAFMNMLKMEENGKFFAMLAQTLEFDPRILQRFVNFLSNPDEDTAIAQFGKGDKYFGATILMVTLPGLPMFAHAQIEGFEEKYGMEYRRAYWDEHPDEALVIRHQHQVFPLMKKRYLFAGASNFRLFPVWNEQGHQCESVFAYTNRSGTERSLVYVNNAYESQSGWIKTAVPVNIDAAASEPKLVAEDVVAALSFDVDNSYFVIYQEQISGLWYIRSVAEIRDNGLFVSLNGYESKVFLNWQLVSETQSTPWSEVHADLQGGGVLDFAPIFRSMELEPVKQLFVNYLKFLKEKGTAGDASKRFEKFAPLFEAMLEMDNISLSIEEIEAFAHHFEDSLQEFRNANPKADATTTQMRTILALARELAVAHPDPEFSLVRTYELGGGINQVFDQREEDDLPGLVAVLEHADKALNLLDSAPHKFSTTILSRESAKRYFMINESEGVVWFNRERMEAFLDVLSRLFVREIKPATLKKVHTAVEKSKFKLDVFLDGLK